MSFLDTLNCPQFVDFESESFHDSTLTDIDALPSCSSIEDDTRSENMDTDEENFSVKNTKSVQSSLCESYLGNSSCQEIEGSLASTSSEIDDNFPVHHHRNLSLHENDKKHSKVNKTTKFKPFHFMESKKRKRENEEPEHIPMAEQVLAFHKKTPQRFHTTGPKSTFESTEHWSPHLVRPKSPNLRAAKRMRGVNAISREEEEQIEAEKIKNYKFRARPVSKNVLLPPRLHSGRHKTPTKAEAFNLRTAQRAAEMAAKKKPEDKPYEFHARPVPKAILNGPTGIKPIPALPATEPKTPNFRLKSRAEKWNSENNLNSTSVEDKAFKAKPAPAPSHPFVVKHEAKPVEIQPFSFYDKDRRRMAQKEQKIREEIEKKNAAFVFKAQPMPSPTPSSLPAVEKKPVTNPQPFNFHLEGRNSRGSSFNLSLDQTTTSFKARPATVLEKPPFVPEKLGKHTVDIEEFNLHTDIRAIERQKLKEINDIKEHEKELALLRLKEQQEELERQAIARLRKEAVHKANPVPQFKPFEIKPSSKPLTEPINPKFETDKRLQQRYHV